MPFSVHVAGFVTETLSYECTCSDELDELDELDEEDELDELEEEDELDELDDESVAAGSVVAGSVAAGSVAAGSVVAGSVAAGSAGLGVEGSVGVVRDEPSSTGSVATILPAYVSPRDARVSLVRAPAALARPSIDPISLSTKATSFSVFVMSTVASS